MNIILQKALESQANDKASVAALNRIREAYFEEYTDATEMDPEFAGAFETIFNILCPFGEDHDVTFYLTKP